MSKLKKPIGLSVLEAARKRIAITFDRFERIYLSFSAGKDSTVMLHLVADEARRRGRKIGLLLVDLEAQYDLTIQHATECFDMYQDIIEPYWISLPLSLRNAVSVYEPKWICFDPEKRQDWVRQPPDYAVTDPDHFPFFRAGMEFEEFIDDFACWYGQGKSTACFVGIRSDESLNRFRTLIKDKRMLDRYRWTTWVRDGVYNVYPIYDWRTEDIWKFSGISRLPQNKIYTLMHKAGVPLSQQRICQPYGDDQRRGLWLYHLLEPQNWHKVLRRVAGVNGGALYARETGNINGVGKITKPENITWKRYSEVLLSSMPPQTREHYEAKIAVFLKWYAGRGFPNGIPDDGPFQKGPPSWARICKALLRNDYWCKGLSFSQTKSANREKYMEMMRERRKRWGIY